MFGAMGPKFMMYYCLGPLMACAVYFPGQQLGYIDKGKRSVFRNEHGQRDSAVLYVGLQILVQAAIIILLNVNFHLALLANLNIGIAQTVHASQAFFVAFLDFIIFGKSLSMS